MQQGKSKKQKVRFTRNDDGTIGVPRDKEASLLDAWHHNEPPVSKTSTAKKTKPASNYKVVVKEFIGKIPRYVAQVKNSALIHKKYTIIIASSIFLLVIIMVIMQNNTNKVTNNDVNNSKPTQQIETNVTPSFPVLTPLGNGVDALGGFAKISPEGTPNVYAYTDVIGAIPIRISQQQLPDNLRTDQATKIKELAEGFNAKETLEIGDNTAYIGTSVSGSQSVVYVKGENLVLIGSDTIIPNSEWVTYIGNLRY